MHTEDGKRQLKNSIPTNNGASAESVTCLQLLLGLDRRVSMSLLGIRFGSVVREALLHGEAAR